MRSQRAEGWKNHSGASGQVAEWHSLWLAHCCFKSSSWDVGAQRFRISMG